MKGYIEERAMEIARYIIDNNTTVRQAAKHFRDQQEYGTYRRNNVERFKGKIVWVIE